MSILNDKQIKKHVNENNMINPFEDKLVSKGISHGLSSMGYDVRCSDEFKIFTNVNSSIVDPKNFSETSFITIKGSEILIPPNSFALVASLEYFKIPRNVLGLVTGKSSYLRCGINTPSSVLEPGWEGQITLEFANTTPLPAKIYAFSGAAQILFFKGEDPEISYADRKGKYQGQTSVTLPKAK